jgi:uncharacterized repeat protein (TIGR03809 family)
MEMLIRSQHRLFPMPEPKAFRRFAQTAQKWRDLVDQRCAHFIELHRTGRWKHYYDETRFLLLMREAVDLAETWSRIAPRPHDDSGIAAAKADPVTSPRRSAAA